jgi:hypothetical protein
LKPELARESPAVGRNFERKQPDHLANLNAATVRLAQVYSRRKELTDEEYIDALR